MPLIPSPDGDLSQEAPWLKVDFRKDPLRYIALIKEYCWEGNVNNGFVVQDNTVRILRWLEKTSADSRSRFGSGITHHGCTMVQVDESP